MLNKKDEIILEVLMHNARIGLKELSRLTSLTKSAVLYRISELERLKFIDKYDTIIDFSKLNLLKEFIFVSINKSKEKDFLRILKSRLEIASCFRTINHENYIILTFYKTIKQKEEFHKLIKQYSSTSYFYSIKDIKFKPYSIFGINLKIKENKINHKILKLDDIDIKLIKSLTYGNARKSILRISQELGISYDILSYRFKRLKKAGYFQLFIAEPSIEKFNINGDFVFIKYKKKSNLRRIIKIINSIRQIFYFCELDDNIILTQILTRDFKEFKTIMKEIKEKIGDENSIDNYLVTETLLLNRFPLEWLRNN